MKNSTYTKAELEELVYSQLLNINAMQDLLCNLQLQNKLVQKLNNELKEELNKFKGK